MGIETALIVGAMAATAGATAYSAHKESKAAKKAAEAQERVGMEQIAAAERSSTLARDEARAKLKLKQASKTPTILSDMEDTGKINRKNLLGV